MTITQFVFIPRTRHSQQQSNPPKTSQTPLPSAILSYSKSPIPAPTADRSPPPSHSSAGSRTFSMLLSRRFSCALARAPSLVRGRPLRPLAAPATPPASRPPPRRLMSSSSAGWQHASRPPPPPPPHPGAEKVPDNTLTLCFSAPISIA